jgi:hypothetical protein
VAVRAVQASAADIEDLRCGQHRTGYGDAARIARAAYFAQRMMPVVKPDSELAEPDRSIKWNYPDVAGLIADPKFREGLKIFLKAKKSELASVGKGLDAQFKREAFDKAIVSHMEGEEGVNMIWAVLQWTPNTGGGILGHNQDDNALAYFQRAKRTAGGLKSMMWTARANLIQDLLNGYTSGDEQDAIFELLTTCPDDSDVHKVIDFDSWDRLEDKVGGRFSKRYPKAQYGKKAK